MLHILERFVIHFGSAAMIYGAVFSLYAYLVRTRRLPPGLSGWWALAAPALLGLLIPVLREPFDAAAAPSLWFKSYFDYASWVLGFGASIYERYRNYPAMTEIMSQIRRH